MSGDTDKTEINFRSVTIMLQINILVVKLVGIEMKQVFRSFFVLGVKKGAIEATVNLLVRWWV